MLDAYRTMEKERAQAGLPPLPLTPAEVEEVCRGLETTGKDDGAALRRLLEDRVAPGVDPAAKVKAGWLAGVAKGTVKSAAVTREDAVSLLGTMLGGYNVDPLVEALSDPVLAAAAAEALKRTVLVYGHFETILKMSAANPHAKAVLESWAAGEWFLTRPAFPETLVLKVFKVEGEINTDDFSPAGHAPTRPDIPLHAQSMGEKRFPGGNAVMKSFRDEGHRVAFVADVVGTGSSRKSACNSLMWHIGEDIPHVPNKRRAGVVIGGLIAPIFFNTAEDSGGLPLMADVTRMKTGDLITLDFAAGAVRDAAGAVLSKLEVKPPTLKDEFRAGGRLTLIIGRQLTAKARKALGLGEAPFFTTVENPKPKPDQGYTLAQKIVGRACGLAGVLPGTACEPHMTTVGSQDTTGPMTADELKELACLEFQADLFMQSFCHTAAYPKAADVKVHRTLPPFMIARKGVSLRPGDGVIHSWLNRLVLPDTVGTGGDSHTRFPIGISFPAGSGLVAFAGALGFMPLDMPESVLVRFKGRLNPGLTLRDAVNAIPYFAVKKGLLTVEKKNKKNVFNGCVLEIEGLEDLTGDQAYELTDASAERSAAACVISLKEERVAEYLRSNVALMEQMIKEGYQSAETLHRRIDACNAWLAKPSLLAADPHASYKAVLEIDLAEITEPLVACPNDPDDVKPLSAIAGDPVQEVFIGSCMTNIGQFRAAGTILDKAGLPSAKVWITPPTKMDAAQLMREGYYSVFVSFGGRTEMPGCSLCMGNQARVAAGTTVFATSTRNFDHRLGDNTRVYLGSSELAALTALKGRIPTVEEYMAVMKEKVLPKAAEIYRYLEFHKMGDFSLGYVR
ncbi:MAG: bifunctional aconitate hydratase 2/2-methylisocitrate dehydratase [Candidatus Aminicenantes bacterium]|nr:bifunctional aconitate hydratase 2/2-methylisocitrate dehydratase [Candidatus Aminicenantes bacterium]NLH76425.1 bifunctional aconitate hydratase 2/2-methylisocitrate dehydratase [Acidobacteriota bacterium]